MLLCSEAHIKQIDMGLVNGDPFLIRVNLGILADMITETSDEMKDRWGQWAYGITAFQAMHHEPVTYQLDITPAILLHKMITFLLVSVRVS